MKVKPQRFNLLESFVLSLTDKREGCVKSLIGLHHTHTHIFLSLTHTHTHALNVHALHRAKVDMKNDAWKRVKMRVCVRVCVCLCVCVCERVRRVCCYWHTVEENWIIFR